MTRLFLAFVCALAACGSESPPERVEIEAGPFCLLGTLPFDLSDTAWRDDQNEDLSASLPRIKHQPADILSNGEVYAYTDVSATEALSSGSYILRGVMARTKDSQGLVSFPIGGELVSLWEQVDSTWTERGEEQSAAAESATPGQYAIDLGIATIGEAFREEYAVLNAERSCGMHGIFELEPGRQVILTDIDATITRSDEEIFLQIADEDYDQLEKDYSVQLTQAWAAKGYQMVYLTARPHVFRAETRAWLRSHGYAEGPVITAPELVLGEAARQFKSEWVHRLRDDLGWQITAAYGNADSDIAAYADGGLDKAVTFIIGELAGQDGTIAIPDDSFEDHIASYVQAQPDATGL